MKKIECHISDEKSQQIDKICDKEGYTRAEFNRRAVEAYLPSFNFKKEWRYKNKKTGEIIISNYINSAYWTPDWECLQD